jgi:hypothetical protein
VFLCAGFEVVGAVLEVMFGKSAEDSKNLDERQNHIGGEKSFQLENSEVESPKRKSQ